MGKGNKTKMKKTYINGYKIELDVGFDKALVFDFTIPSSKDHWKGACTMTVIKLEANEQILSLEEVDIAQIQRLSKFIDNVLQIKDIS